MGSALKIGAVVLALFLAWRFFSARAAGVSASAGAGGSAPVGSLSGSGSSADSLSIGQKLKALIASGVPSVTVKLHGGKQGSITVPDYYGLGQSALQQELNDLGKTYGDGVGYTLFQRIQAGDSSALYSSQSGTEQYMAANNNNSIFGGSVGKDMMMVSGTLANLASAAMGGVGAYSSLMKL